VNKKLAKSIWQIETVAMHAGHSGRQQAELSKDSDYCGPYKAIAIQASQGREFRINCVMG